jgi:GH15 family glucan-1,4-alpha-glucosidase
VALDASALLALHFGFFAPDSPEAASHVDAIASRLRTNGLLRRYDCEDDFGEPQAAFTVCSFWLAEALAILGRMDEARALFEKILGYGNEFGLFSEDVVPSTGELSGNFPQTYSHVGLINVAFRISPAWD